MQQTPYQPAAPAWQNPVQQSQQGNWQADPNGWQTQQQYQPGPDYAQQQPAWQPQQVPYGGRVKKKRAPVALIIIALVVVAAGVLAALNLDRIRGTFTRTFASPEQYYQSVEEDSVQELASTVSAVNENVFLDNATSEDQNVTGTVSLQIGDGARDLLVDLLGEYLDELNAGDDLSWAKTLTVTYGVNRKNDLGSLDAALRLNGTDILTLNGVLDIADGSVWLSIPELSSRYLETTLEDLDLEGITGSLDFSGGFGVSSLLSSVSPETAELLDPIMKALPDGETADRLISKYLNEAVDMIEDVEKDSGTLTAEGVSADYDTLTVTIDADTLQAIAEKLIPEIKADRDIKEIINDVADAAEEDGGDSYDKFCDSMDDLLDKVTEFTDSMTDDIVMTVYLDNAGDVHGRRVTYDETVIELLMPEKGSDFGLRINVEASGKPLLITGKGKRSGDKLTGTLELEFDDEYYCDIDLDGFDTEKLKQGYLNGGITLSPTASLWSLLEEQEILPESVVSLIEDFSFRLDLDTSKSKAQITLTVLSGRDMFLTLSLDGTVAAGKNVSSVSGVEPQEWTEDISLDQLERVVSSLDRAGVPEAYTDLIDQLLDSYFG